MIHTDSRAYIQIGSQFTAATADGWPGRWFISVPCIDDVRELLRSEIPEGVVLASTPILFVTRLMPPPILNPREQPIDFQI